MTVGLHQESQPGNKEDGTSDKPQDNKLKTSNFLPNNIKSNNSTSALLNNNTQASHLKNSTKSSRDIIQQKDNQQINNNKLSRDQMVDKESSSTQLKSSPQQRDSSQVC